MTIISGQTDQIMVEIFWLEYLVENTCKPVRMLENIQEKM